ncbi:Undecaprenyl-phosphate mannosyltransferase [Planctomycetes bacterium MalM25]|nr:Undecaprenyl-phosphate mannosyltransferase [Planctomycetes bacterium MalM25]
MEDQEGPSSSEPLHSVAVILPALNEEESIRRVLEALPPVGRVIVVDNGSTDATAQIAADAGAEVVAEPRRGYGSACLAGMAEIERGEAKPAVVVFLDADASDDPGLLPLLVEPILAGEADFVLGSRMRGEREPGAMPPVAAFGNHFASWLMRTFWKASYTDLGPFRAIRYESLIALGMIDRDYGWTIEMQMKALRHGLRVREIPVPYRRRIGRSKISGTVRGSLAAGTKILLTLARYGWSR